MELKDYTTEELRAELKRRNDEEKKSYVFRCRICKHWGAIDQWGYALHYSTSDNRCCKFFRTVNGENYRVHAADQLACKYFEMKE